MKFLKKISMGSVFAILLGLLSIAIILGSYYLINKKTDHDFESNISILSDLQQLDSKWSVSILKTKSYTLQDFDTISSYLLAIQDNFDILEERGLSEVEKVGKETVKNFQIYKQSFALKNEAVEHYKSEQAILRNSVRYLPVITKQIQQLMNSKKGMLLKYQITSSSLLVNQFLLTGGAKKHIKSNLVLLTEQLKTQPINIQDLIKNYIVHANIILRYKTKASAMLKRSMSKGFDNLSKNLINSYSASREQSSQFVQYLQAAMMLGSLMLLAVMLWFLIHFIRVNQQVVEVRKDVIEFERRSAAGDLALGAFHQMKYLMPKFYHHVDFIKKLKIDFTLLEQRNDLKSFDMDADRKTELNKLSTDIDTIYGTISEIEHIINQKGNNLQDIKFNFNHIILKAIETVAKETNGRITFTQQLKDVSIVKGSPLDLFQIIVKLFRQVAKVNNNQTSHKGQTVISVKSWGSQNFANLLINLPIQTDSYFQQESLGVIRKLIEENKGKFKFMTEKGSEKSAITLSLVLLNPRIK